ncbi:MAG: FliM/FliN family flagellar motor switch protein [Pseudomonadota bacterium]
MSTDATSTENVALGDDVGATLRKMLRPSQGTLGAANTALERETDEIFRKTAKNSLKLDLVVDEFSIARKNLNDALAGRPQIGLSMMTSADDGRLGMFVFDGALIDGLIEQQLLGYVARAPRVDRPVTRIDAELSRGFASAILKAYSQKLKDDPSAKDICGFASPVMETDMSALKLVMVAPAYTVLSVFLDLGPGQKTGTAQIWFPVSEVSPKEDRPMRDAVWAQAIEHRVREAPIEARTYLPPLKVSLATFVSLKPGGTIPVPVENLNKAVLRDVKGNQLATGRLGQLSGSRAFRVETCVMQGGAAAISEADAEPAAAGLSSGLAALAEIEATPGAQAPPLPDLPAIGVSDDLPDLGEFAPQPSGGSDDLPDLGSFAPQPAEKDGDLPEMPMMANPISID